VFTEEVDLLLSNNPVVSGSSCPKSVHWGSFLFKNTSLTPLLWQRVGNPTKYNALNGDLMRTIKTIILRLYLDSEVSDRLCGDMQTQPERKIIYFQDEEGLVTLLRKIAAQTNGAGKDSDLTGDESVRE
jgi:hypothetical protein